MAVRALQDGAFDFLAKPFAAGHLAASASKALAARGLVLDNRRLRADTATRTESPLIGDSPAMVRLRETIAQVARADIDVLIEGETGTGKELVAAMLHRGSPRSARPFVAVSCAALPEAHAEIELLGHAADAVPGARSARTGRIEVRTPDVARVRELLDGVVDEYDAERILVRAADPAALNEQLVRAGVRVTALGVERRSLEQVVLEAATASGDRFGVRS